MGSTEVTAREFVSEQPVSEVFLFPVNYHYCNRCARSQTVASLPIEPIPWSSQYSVDDDDACTGL